MKFRVKYLRNIWRYNRVVQYLVTLKPGIFIMLKISVDRTYDKITLHPSWRNSRGRNNQVPPVSYTHLDVYKRQEVMCGLHLQRNSQNHMISHSMRYKRTMTQTETTNRWVFNNNDWKHTLSATYFLLTYGKNYLARTELQYYSGTTTYLFIS